MEVLDASFVVGDVSVLTLDAPDPFLEVTPFRDWASNTRWASYNAGQQVLLFLAKPRKADSTSKAPWRIRGLGGEGEMPVENDFVFLHGMFLEGFPKESFTVQGGTLTGYRFNLSTFLSAFRGYNRCFSLGTGF